MRKKRSELNDLIKLSNIQLEIGRLETLLDSYQHSIAVKKNRYFIKSQFDELRASLSNVQEQLEVLKVLSLKWELDE